jgi:lysophospholipase L1-like esterase
MDCMILGDSLAVGIAQNLPQCEAHAQVGITTHAFYMRSDKWSSDTVLISLGSNDLGPAPIQYDVLRKFRKTINAKRVFWVLPNVNQVARLAIKDIAKDNGDYLIDAKNSETSPDRIHPTARGYREIAKQVPVLK